MSQLIPARRPPWRRRRWRGLPMAGLWLALTVGTARAQPVSFHYPRPAAGSVTASRDVPYGRTDSVTLAMDVFRPAHARGRLPALVFFNRAFGPERRGDDFYARWAETAAAQGIVAIVPDLRGEHLADDFHALLDHLTRRAAAYGLDPEAIAVYAASGNVSGALPVLEDSTATRVRAVVIYYGAAELPALRRDLPLLIVRAGLDRPGANASVDRLVARATAENVPVTLLNVPAGFHAFEMRNEGAATRDAIDRTLDFVKRATAVEYQAGIRAGLGLAAAAADVANGRFAEAAERYAGLAAADPENATLGLAWGEALLGAEQYVAACDRFDRLRGSGLGARDLGLPAARACLAKGDPDGAMAWLRSIPSRFLPASVRTDPALAALRDRPDFKALFEHR